MFLTGITKNKIANSDKPVGAWHKKGESWAIIFIILGLIACVIAIYYFLCQNGDFKFSQKIDSNEFDHFGSFISGVVGTLWGLASIILVYVALRDQKLDIETNREALKVQIEEFKLQRKELESTRAVFEEQAKTQKYQRFENTFFQLLTVHNQIINAIDFVRKDTEFVSKQETSYLHTHATKPKYEERIKEKDIIYGRSCFKYFYDEMRNIMSEDDNITHEVSYVTFYEENHGNLGHYFRNLYHIIKFVNMSDIDKDDKSKYTNLVRSQLSSYELALIYYNGLSNFGKEKFKPLIEEYGLLKNQHEELILECVTCVNKYDEKAFQ